MRKTKKQHIRDDN